MRRALPILLLLATMSGCFRLSDPAYGFKPLEAPEPPGPEYSLLFISVKDLGGTMLGGEVFSIWFKRVDPHGLDTPYVGATNRVWFRAFRARAAKDGDFLVVLPPGVYELDGLEQQVLFSTRNWRISGEAKVASRIHITRPGIYDLGTLTIQGATWGTPASLQVEGDAFSDERLRLLRAAVKGTRWQGVLDQRPPRKKRTAPPTGTVAWLSVEGQR